MEKEQKKRLRKSRRDGIFAGVCGGIAEYVDWDPTIVRLLTIILGIFNPTTLIVYLAAALIMPD